ncbi:MAG: alpha/beta hydrolase [Lacibacter sp.]
MLQLLKYHLALLLLFPFLVKAQEVMNLYPGTIPNARQTTLTEDSTDKSGSLIRRVITPTLEIYLPQKEIATGAAVIICPGGSYKVLVYQGEGIATAKEFAKKGVAAFVLRYRLPNDSFVVDKSIAPLQDAQQAIKRVRENASTWAIDSNKIGIIGFSAGGHLASTAATHFQKALIENKNNTSLRPDFLILIYPVISMQDSLTHIDSRKNLLGAQLSKEMVDNFSNELQVTEQSPPAYITHAGDDKLVDVDNSILFYEALRHHNVSAEMHIYPAGGHGFIFRQKGWMNPLFEWMQNSKWINSTKQK